MEKMNKVKTFQLFAMFWLVYYIAMCNILAYRHCRK